MAHFGYIEPVKRKPLHERIMANLRVQASWIDKVTGKRVSVEGLTENIGENSALVNLETLPPVGSEVNLIVIDDEKTLIEVPTEVIRVERDPSKPMAALFNRRKPEKLETECNDSGRRMGSHPMAFELRRRMGVITV